MADPLSFIKKLFGNADSAGKAFGHLAEDAAKALTDEITLALKNGDASKVDEWVAKLKNHADPAISTLARTDVGFQAASIQLKNYAAMRLELVAQLLKGQDVSDTAFQEILKKHHLIGSDGQVLNNMKGLVASSQDTLNKYRQLSQEAAERLAGGNSVTDAQLAAGHAETARILRQNNPEIARLADNAAPPSPAAPPPTLTDVIDDSLRADPADAPNRWGNGAAQHARTPSGPADPAFSTSGGTTGASSPPPAPPPSAAPSPSAATPPSPAGAARTAGTAWTRRADGLDATPNLPAQDLGLDKFKLAAHLRMGGIPFRVFTVEAMRPRAYKVFEPVIKHLDNQMAERGVTEAIQKLDRAVIDAADEATAQRLIQDFAHRNREALTRFREDALELKNHVATTYKTNKERGFVNGVGQDTTSWRHDLTTRQKDDLLKYLGDVATMADDLLQGTSGKNGQQMLETLRKIHADPALREVARENIAGMSSAYKAATDAQIRLTGNFPNGAKAVQEYKDLLVRALNNRGYNSLNVNTLDTHLSVEAVRTQNVEFSILGPFMHHADRNADGSFKKNFRELVEGGKEFFDPLAGAIRAGLGPDAVLAVDKMARKAQFSPKVGAKNPFPTAERFKEAAKLYKDGEIAAGRQLPPDYDFFVNQMTETIQNTTTNIKGAPIVTFFPWLQWTTNLKVNRVSEYLAEEATSKLERLYWWRGAGLYSKAADLEHRPTFRHLFLNKPASFIFGGRGVDVEMSNINGITSPDYMSSKIKWRETDANGAPTESALSVPRRAASRILSGGLVSDVTSWKPWQWQLTTFGRVGLLGGGAAWGAGAAYDKLIGDEDSDKAWLGRETVSGTLWAGGKLTDWAYTRTNPWGWRSPMTFASEYIDPPAEKKDSTDHNKGNGSPSPTTTAPAAASAGVAPVDLSAVEKKAAENLKFTDLSKMDLAAIQTESAGRAAESGMFGKSAIIGNVSRADTLGNGFLNALKDFEARGKTIDDAIAAYQNTDKTRHDAMVKLKAQHEAGLAELKHNPNTPVGQELHEQIALRYKEIEALAAKIKDAKDPAIAANLLQMQRDHMIKMEAARLTVLGMTETVDTALKQGAAIAETKEQETARLKREQERQAAIDNYTTLAGAKEKSSQIVKQGQEIFDNATKTITALNGLDTQIAERLKTAEGDEKTRLETLQKQLKDELAKVNSNTADDIKQLQEKFRDNNLRLQKLFADVNAVQNDEKLSTVRALINEQIEILKKMDLDNKNLEKQYSAFKTAFEERKPYAAPAPVTAAPAAPANPGSTSSSTSTGGGSTSSTVPPLPANATQEQRDLHAILVNSFGNRPKQIASYLDNGTNGVRGLEKSINEDYEKVKAWHDHFKDGGNGAALAMIMKNAQEQQDQARLSLQTVLEEQKKLTEFNDKLRAIQNNNALTDTQKLAEAQKIDHEGKEYTTRAEAAFKNAVKARENMTKILNDNESIRRFVSNQTMDKGVEDGINLVAGGKGSILDDLFVSKNGSRTGVETMFNKASNAVSGYFAWWDNAKRNAKTEGERTTMKWLGAGGTALGLLIGWNVISEIVKSTTGKDLKAGWMGWAAMAAVVVMAIRGSGETGRMYAAMDEQKQQDRLNAKANMVGQVDSGKPRHGTTVNTGTPPAGTPAPSTASDSPLPFSVTAHNSGGERKAVPIPDTTGATLQNSNGGVPYSDIRVETAQARKASEFGVMGSGQHAVPVDGSTQVERVAGKTSGEDMVMAMFTDGAGLKAAPKTAAPAVL